MSLGTLITFLEIIISIALIALIALQDRSSGAGGAFGGAGGSSLHHTRRGMEKILFQTTIGLVIVFVGLALTSLLL